jgi:hypothetical protein
MGLSFAAVWTYAYIKMPNRIEVEMKVFYDRMDRAGRGEYKGIDVYDWTNLK